MRKILDVVEVFLGVFGKIKEKKGRVTPGQPLPDNQPESLGRGALVFPECWVTFLFLTFSQAKFREGISFPNFVKRSVLKLRVCKNTLYPPHGQNQNHGFNIWF